MIIVDSRSFPFIRSNPRRIPHAFRIAGSDFQVRRTTPRLLPGGPERWISGSHVIRRITIVFRGPPPSSTHSSISLSIRPSNPNFNTCRSVRLSEEIEPTAYGDDNHHTSYDEDDDDGVAMGMVDLRDFNTEKKSIISDCCDAEESLNEGFTFNDYSSKVQKSSRAGMGFCRQRKGCVRAKRMTQCHREEGAGNDPNPRVVE